MNSRDPVRVMQMLLDYQRGASYASIGREWGISGQRVRQILIPQITLEDMDRHREAMKAHRIRFCEYRPCGKRFEASGQSTRFCSRNCVGLSRRKPFPPLKRCEFCGQIMTRKEEGRLNPEDASMYKKRRFCDTVCSAWHRHGHPKPQIGREGRKEK